MAFVLSEERRLRTSAPAQPIKSRQPLAAHNSLDYWQKKNDNRSGGVTYYWNAPVYGLENVYAKTSSRRPGPAPFPLNLPSTTTVPPTTTISPVVYHNVVTMPRARLAEKSTPKDSPIFSAKRLEENVIWSVDSHRNHVAPAPQPSAPLTMSPGCDIRGNGSADRLRSSSRQKPPRWGRIFHSLCCCVAPRRDQEKPRQPQLSNPALLITQVQKNGTGTQQSHAPSHVGDANDYIPTVIANGSTTTTNATVVVPAGKEQRHLLPPLRPADSNKKCLIIDLDETLVHSSFKPVKNADFVIPVEIDGVEHKVYVLKRPYVDEFLARVGERFECVLFTASLAKYADPVADLLDKRGVFRSRLFREACVLHKGNYVKDLARLGRDLTKVLIIDNSPASYAFHPDNAIPVQTWFDDPTDVELLDILPLLDRLERVDSVYNALRRPSGDSAHDSLLNHDVSS